MKNNQKSSILIFISLLLFNLNYQYQYNNMKENLDMNINRITVFSFMQANTIESLEKYNSISSILSLNILYLSLIYSSIINYKDYILKNSF